ncbi:MAG: hypothetical protein A2174_03005 [Candidatus Portnoybacteria bacterium RBG_13_41_18]|uniref:Inhibitor I9 domain-containing protein n=1 Tax=Candidatus Portnoybacteria bacterium RBG_13_41_18 TaxID=1801991 RepID=A0A1G2F7L9_9BACT|nr:MAG: hypothetical protein A2174_03005 [Candidatus Portnoybacteria bacterium RBG_13_41_18]
MIFKKTYVIVGVAIVVLIGAVAIYLATQKPDFNQSQTDNVQAIIKQNGSARVIVNLKGNKYTSSEFQSDNAKKMEEVGKIQNRVLGTLNAQDISSIGKFTYSPGFSGVIKQTGYDKLLVNPEVDSIQEDKTVEAN